ncbi:MAG: hypothetical protein ACTSVE_04655, partial [Candidatus Helarchaeota archaeon]
QDNHLQLANASLIVFDTNTVNGKPMKLVDIKSIPSLNNGVFVKVFSFNHDNLEFKKSYIDFLKSITDDTDLFDIIWKYYEDVSKWEGYLPSITSKETLLGKLGANIDRYLLTRRPGEFSAIQRNIRGMLEWALIRKAILSNLGLKYIIIDGSLTILEPLRIVEEKKFKPVQLPFNDYLMRATCHQARKNNIILAAISKTHSVPGSLHISSLARSLGYKDHWFCRIPGKKDPDDQLFITQTRKYIPPDLAVTYLVKFYHLMPTLRIDFDYFWWIENIKNSDPDVQKENEIKIFKDLDFMAHEARFYGYPCPPGFAHEDCVITWDQQLAISDHVIEIGKSLGLDERALISARKLIFK